MTADARTATPYGYFVTFEGGEGSGKSTLIQEFADDLRQQGHPDIVITREPGGSPTLGPVIREILLGNNTGIPLTPWAEALLFAAERAQHVEEVVRPVLNRGGIVLCDRYIDSSVSYQGVGRGLGEMKVRRISTWGTKNLNPDWSVLLDLDPEIGLARRGAASDMNRLDRETLQFHTTIREALLSIAHQDSKRWSIIDAAPPLPVVHESILAAWNERQSKNSLRLP